MDSINYFSMIQERKKLGIYSELGRKLDIVNVIEWNFQAEYWIFIDYLRQLNCFCDKFYDFIMLLLKTSIRLICSWRNGLSLIYYSELPMWRPCLIIKVNPSFASTFLAPIQNRISSDWKKEIFCQSLLSSKMKFI